MSRLNYVLHFQRDDCETREDTKYYSLTYNACADPESFVRADPTLIIFLAYERREDPNITNNGPPSARQRNDI